MVVRPFRREPLRFLEDGAVLLQEAVQHGLLGVRDGCQRALLRRVRGGGAYALPADATPARQKAIVMASKSQRMAPKVRR